MRSVRIDSGAMQQTIDYRYAEKRSRRSSFALVSELHSFFAHCHPRFPRIPLPKSDIFELDEDEEEVEVDVSPILPLSPDGTSSISTTDTVRSRMKNVLVVSSHSAFQFRDHTDVVEKDILHAVKAGWGSSRSPGRAYSIEVRLQM